MICPKCGEHWEDHKPATWNKITLDAGTLTGPYGSVRISAGRAEILYVLIKARGRPVQKDTLINMIWDGGELSERSYYAQIANLRRDCADVGVHIRCQYNIGYYVDVD